MILTEKAAPIIQTLQGNWTALCPAGYPSDIPEDLEIYKRVNQQLIQNIKRLLTLILNGKKRIEK